MNSQARILTASLIVLTSAGVGLYSYARLPEKVPIHFDGAGNPNGWGPKKIATAMPVGLMLFMCGIWAISVRALQTREYWEKKMRTPVSAEALEKMAAGSIKVIDLVLILTMAMFLTIQVQTYLVGTGKIKGLTGIWVFIAILMVVALYGAVQGLIDRRRAEEEASRPDLTKTGQK
jgi:uncharacterized membrane protein